MTAGTVTPAVVGQVLARDLHRCIDPAVVCALLTPGGTLPAGTVARWRPAIRAWTSERRALDVCAGARPRGNG
ncbi:MAG: hypothetical protein M0T80_14705 [Actinomycetota bacterium]|nr:hypothetical protein [Actinomycetota bacterium]